MLPKKHLSIAKKHTKYFTAQYCAHYKKYRTLAVVTNFKVSVRQLGWVFTGLSTKAEGHEGETEGGNTKNRCSHASNTSPLISALNNQCTYSSTALSCQLSDGFLETAHLRPVVLRFELIFLNEWQPSLSPSIFKQLFYPLPSVSYIHVLWNSIHFINSWEKSASLPVKALHLLYFTL